MDFGSCPMFLEVSIIPFSEFYGLSTHCMHFSIFQQCLISIYGCYG